MGMLKRVTMVGKQNRTTTTTDVENGKDSKTGTKGKGVHFSLRGAGGDGVKGCERLQFPVSKSGLVVLSPTECPLSVLFEFWPAVGQHPETTSQITPLSGGHWLNPRLVVGSVVSSHPVSCIHNGQRCIDRDNEIAPDGV